MNENCTSVVALTRTSLRAQGVAHKAGSGFPGSHTSTTAAASGMPFKRRNSVAAAVISPTVRNSRNWAAAESEAASTPRRRWAYWMNIAPTSTTSPTNPNKATNVRAIRINA